MADYTQIKQLIADYIKTNGNEEITGNLLQNILKEMMDEVNTSKADYASETDLKNKMNILSINDGEISEEHFFAEWDMYYPPYRFQTVPDIISLPFGDTGPDREFGFSIFEFYGSEEKTITIWVGDWDCDVHLYAKKRMGFIVAECKEYSPIVIPFYGDNFNFESSINDTSSNAPTTKAVYDYVTSVVGDINSILEEL